MQSTVVKVWGGYYLVCTYHVSKWQRYFEKKILLLFCTEFYSDPAHTYQSRVESRDDWSLLFIWIYCLYSHYIHPQLSWNYLRKQQNLNALWTYTTFIFLLYFVALCFSVSPKCTFYFLPNAAFPSSKSLQQYIAVAVANCNRFLILLAFAFWLHIQEGETNLTIKSALKLQ